MGTMAWTKVIGAACGSLLGLLLIQWVAEEMYHSHGDSHQKVAYLLEIEEEAPIEKAVVEEIPFIELLASADASKGKKKIRHLIYISSSMVYGNFDGKEVKEDDKLNPIGIYGTLKLSGELMVKAYNQVFGMPYTIIRPSALYGERCVSRRVSQIFIDMAEDILKKIKLNKLSETT